MWYVHSSHCLKKTTDLSHRQTIAYRQSQELYDCSQESYPVDRRAHNELRSEAHKQAPPVQYQRNQGDSLVHVLGGGVGHLENFNYK